MWIQEEDYSLSESDGESGSEDEGQMQCEVLEKQRDEANQKLSELEEASGQLLKEMNLLEIQFQIERSCRESAEALAVKVTRENTALKRRSQMLLPLIPELPEHLAKDPTVDLSKDPTVDPSESLIEDLESAGVNGEDVCDGASLDDPLLLSQAKITELQASVDGLLAEKLQLESQVELLTKEQTTLGEQLAMEAQEKEAILRRMNKQSKTMNKIKRVSELVTEEFTEMSQRLELEQGLRQHAEVWAVQMLEVQKRNATPLPSHETNVQLQQALEQISQVTNALCDIQRYYQIQGDQNTHDAEEVALRCELQVLKEKLKTSECEKNALETQLTEASGKVTLLQQEVKQFQDSQKSVVSKDEPEEEKPHAGVPPPPPPPPPSTAPVVNTLEFVKQRRKNAASKSDPKNGTSITDMKSKAVDEMMKRIKEGVILRPPKPVQVGIMDDDSAWKDQRSDNRKSAIVELKGVLNNLKLNPHRRVSSRRGVGRNVGEAELLSVLQRRRRAMGDSIETMGSAQGTQDQPSTVKTQEVPWFSESGTAPVLRRLKQNRDHRDSRIRASALAIDPDKPPQ